MGATCTVSRACQHCCVPGAGRGHCVDSFLYAYPADVRDDVIAAMAEEPKVCNYLEMPLQHCDARVLKAMNRGGSRAELERHHQAPPSYPRVDLAHHVHRRLPRRDGGRFRELEAFVEWAHFERMGAFTYSQEEGTPAGVMPARSPRGSKSSAGTV